MWTLDCQMIERCVEIRLQAQMINMTISLVGILSRLLAGAVEMRMLSWIDDCRLISFIIPDTSRGSLENARLEVYFEVSIGSASHVSQDETVAVPLEIAEEEK